MARVFLSLGSNKGNRHEYIRLMLDSLRLVLKGPLCRSRLMETEAVDVARPQNAYLNLVVSGEFDGSPAELLGRCDQIERELGREAKGQRLPRTADIDLLLFGTERIRGSGLTIPHPGIFTRRFCLAGIGDIEPQAAVPRETGITTVANLLDHVPQNLARQRVEFLSFEYTEVPAGPPASKEERSEM